MPHASACQASLFPRSLLQALARMVLTCEHLNHRMPRAAAELLLFDLRTGAGAPAATPPREGAAPERDAPRLSQRAGADDVSADAPASQPAPVAPDADFSSLLRDLQACGDSSSATAGEDALRAVVAVLSRIAQEQQSPVLAALAMHELDDTCTLALCRALEAAPDSIAPLSSATRHALLVALLTDKAAGLASPASRQLCDALAAAAAGAPAVTAKAVSSALLLGEASRNSGEVNPRSAGLVHRALDAAPGGAHASALLLALCEADAWSSHVIPGLSRIVAAKPVMAPATLLALTIACESAACGALGQDIHFVKLCAAIATSLAPLLRDNAAAAAALRRAVAATRTFLTDASLARLDKL